MSITKKRRYDSWETYIRRIHKQVHPDGGISGEGMSTMEALLDDGLRQIVQKANLLASKMDKKTLNTAMIQAAIHLTIPGELKKHAITEGTKAVRKYKDSKGGGLRVSAGARAGLTLAPSRVKTAMVAQSCLERKSETAAVYLAAVLEYLAAEVLELAGNSASKRGRKRVDPRDILLAVRNDIELSRLYAKVVLPGGVIPNIEEALIPKKGAKKPRKKKTTKKKKKKTTKKRKK